MVDHGAKTKTGPSAADLSEICSRVDSLVAMIDHCNAAKEAADQLDEKFLSYLLSMVIQEAKSTMRRTR